MQAKTFLHPQRAECFYGSEYTTIPSVPWTLKAGDAQESDVSTASFLLTLGVFLSAD